MSEMKIEVGKHVYTIGMCRRFDESIFYTVQRSGAKGLNMFDTVTDIESHYPNLVGKI